MSDLAKVHKFKVHGLLVLLPALLLSSLLITHTETTIRTTRILLLDGDVKAGKPPAPKEYKVPQNEEKVILSYLFLLPLVTWLGPWWL